MPKGLSESVVVVDRKTGQEVKGIFALKPDTDPAARAALLTYAHAVEADNYKLAQDLRLLMLKYEAEDRANRQQLIGEVEIPDWLRDMHRDNGSESNS
jgi:hypothetical protein